jgi:hypothetical protein
MRTPSNRTTFLIIVAVGCVALVLALTGHWLLAIVPGLWAGGMLLMLALATLFDVVATLALRRERRHGR